MDGENEKPTGDKRGVLDHVEIYVSDLDRSRRFWGWFLDKLGYSVSQEWEEGVSFRRGATYLVFVQTRKKYLDPAYHR